MSALNIGINDVSEETQAFKDKLASKDGHIAAQETKLMRQAGEMEELRSTLNDALHKLTHETNRVLELESTLRTRSQDLQNEKIASQNIAQALAAAQQQVKERDRDARDLQMNLESLSHVSDGNNARCSQLEREKGTLQAHIRDLQANIQQLTCPPTTPCSKRLPPRPRSSSVPDSRIITLEQELAQLRAVIKQRDAELGLAVERFSQAQNESMRVGNEKLALEKRASRQISDLQASLEEKDEELLYHRRRHDDGSRERELMDRIEEDGAKIAALERLLGEKRDVSRMKEMLKQCERDLAEERKHVQDCENRKIELSREKEEALDALQHARQEMAKLRESLLERKFDMQKRQSDISNQHTENNLMDVDSVEPCFPHLSSTTAADAAVAHIARLLTAIERLRSERDGLRRSMLFLESEHKFTVDGLEGKRELTSNSSVVGVDQNAIIAQMQSEINLLRSQLAKVDEKDGLTQRLYRAVDTLTIILRHISSHIDECETCITDVSASRREVEERFNRSQKTVIELECRLKDLEVKLEGTVLCLEATATQRNHLMSQLESKESENEEEVACLNAAHQQTRDDLKQAEKSIGLLESERNSLKLQVTSLAADLQVAQKNITNAESRYSELQFHQLSSMSSNEANQVLRDRITELEMRVMRRTEQIGIHQHDIKRMETNLRLQEERLAEMTTELEIISEQKDAMVEDCADARETRDGALARLETLEMNTEMRLEEADETVEALVGVIFKTVANMRNTIQNSVSGAVYLKEKLDEQHRRNLAWHEEKDAFLKAELATQDDARQSALALALSQDGLGKALASLGALTQERDQLRQDIRSQQDHLDREVAETQSLTAQLEILQHDARNAQSGLASQISSLESQIQDLRYAIAESEIRHQTSVDELQLSREFLRTKLDDMQHSLADSSTPDELALLRERHTKEINETRALLTEAQSALERSNSFQEVARAELQMSLADALSRKLELEEQQAETSERLRQSIQELEHNQKDVVQLQNKLNGAISEAREAEKARDQFQVSYNRIIDELSQAKKDAELQEAELSQRTLVIKQALENELVDLQNKLEERSLELDRAVKETERLLSQLQEEEERHKADDEMHVQQLASVNRQHGDTEAALVHLRQELQIAENQLEKSRDDIKVLQQDKSSLQEEITTLEAEIQRSISLSRFLESQVKESESKISSIADELDRTRTDLAISEKSAKAAEVNLSLQSVQHKREMTDLRRQLTILQSQPDLQAAISELEERNNEMEELLRNKCAEIEENDDRALEMLKENKKLATKVESLTRKVQNLQTKLAAAKASIPKASEALSNSHPAPPPEPLANPVNVASTSRSRPSTLTSTNPTPSASTHAPSPIDSVPFHRAVSGPPLPRPKTPERKMTQPSPVFKAQTPDRRPVAPDPMPSTSSIGKKRRAPDDFEACESVPPQGFTADSLPSRDHVESTTPRVRRVLSGLQSGFTPKRRQNPRPTVAMPSPRRATTGTSARTSPVIADVTNSPRGSSQTAGQSAKEKRSWLGKIRGQTTSKTMDSSRARFERESS